MISVLFPTILQVMTSYDYSEYLQNIGLGQADNQNVKNNDFWLKPPAITNIFKYCSLNQTVIALEAM